MLSTLKRAALMRCMGHTWPQVAGKLKRSVATVRSWPCQYRTEWKRLMAEAMDQADDELIHKANRVIADMLDSKDEKLRIEAAKMINWRYLRLREIRARAEAVRDHHDEVDAAAVVLPDFLTGMRNNGHN